MKQQTNRTKKQHAEHHRNIHRTYVLILAFLLLALLGFAFEVSQEKQLTFTVPREKTVLETTSTPGTLENVDCSLPDYDIVREEAVNLFGRKIALRNNQDESWSFTLQVNFTFTNRTTNVVPRQTYEQKETSVTISGGDTKEITVFPATNGSRYGDAYTVVTVVPEPGDCDIRDLTYSRERTTRQTLTEEQTFTVPYAERKNLWKIFWQWLRTRS